MKLTLNPIVLLAIVLIAPLLTRADDSAPLTSQQFVWQAGTAGLEEVYLGQVALQNSQNPDVRHFGERMVRDHSKANKKLMKIASEESLDFPPTNLFSVEITNSAGVNANVGTVPFNTPGGMDTNNLKGAEQLVADLHSPTNGVFMVVQHLQALSGPDFDRAYASQMVQDHAQAIQLFEQASADIPDKDLKKFAEKTLPVLRKHYQMAQDLESKVEAGSTNQPSMGAAQ